MESVISFETGDHAQTHHTSRVWANSNHLEGPSSSSEFSLLDNSLECAMTSQLNVKENPEMSLLLESQMMALMASTQLNNRDGLTTLGQQPVSTFDEIGVWNAVSNDKSTKSNLSLTGTEIWGSTKNVESDEKEKSVWKIDNNKPSIGPDARSDDDDDADDREAIIAITDGWKSNEGSGGGDTSSSSISPFGSSNVDMTSRSSKPSGGWGNMPICQDKPWDLCDDGAILEICALRGGEQQEAPEQGDGRKDDGLDIWKSLVINGKMIDAGCDERDVLRHPIEMIHSNNDHLQRPGSSVSGLDGYSQLIGRGDQGHNNLGDLGWMTPSFHRQSSWGASDQASHVDDGTALWNKNKQISVDEETALKTDAGDKSTMMNKLLTSRAFPPFNVDVSVPPPPLNTPHTSLRSLPPGLMPPNPSLADIAPFLSQLQSSQKRLNSPPIFNLSTSNSNGFTSGLMRDFSEKQWMPHQNRTSEQMRWPGNSYQPSNNSESWNYMLQQKATNRRAPTTRSKLLQHLITMGFKREDAQNALISSNMDLEKAFELLALKSVPTKVNPSHAPSFAPPPPHHHHHQRHQLPPTNLIFGRPRQNMMDNENDVLSNLLASLSHQSGGELRNDREMMRLTNQIDALRNTTTSDLSMFEAILNRNVGLLSPAPLPSPSPPPHPFMHHPYMQQPKPIPYPNFPIGSANRLVQRSFSQIPISMDNDLVDLFSRQMSFTEPAIHDTMKPEIQKVVQALNKSQMKGDDILKMMDQRSNNVVLDDLCTFHSSSCEMRGGGRIDEMNDDDKIGLRFDGGPDSFNDKNRSFSSTYEGIGDNSSSSSSPSSHQIIDTKTSNTNKLPSAFQVKEFIPGKPWKSGQQQQQQDISPASILSSEQECLMEMKSTAIKKSEITKCLPSKWIQLKSLPDKISDNVLKNICSQFGSMKIFNKESDGSVLISYVKLKDAVKAQSSLDRMTFNGDEKMMATYVKDWMAAAADDDEEEKDAVTVETKTGGYLTPGGLWIPPTDAAAYYDEMATGGANWNSEYVDSWQEENHENNVSTK